MPFYPITTKGSDAKRVVEADNPSAAMKHVSEAMFTVDKPMKPGDIVSFMSGGGKVEKAGQPAAAPEPADGDDTDQGKGAE